MSHHSLGNSPDHGLGDVGGRAAELRDAFDASFAVAPSRDGDAATEDVLGITVAGEPYALRLASIVELVVGRPITRLDGAVPGLLGIAGLRGALIPVFDLAALLGRDERVPLRWLALTRNQPRVALAFAQLDGHLRVPRSAIASELGGAQRSAHVRDVARIDGVLRPIIQVASILDTIASSAGATATSQGAARR